jgi:hypothetical protein
VYCSCGCCVLDCQRWPSAVSDRERADGMSAAAAAFATTVFRANRASTTGSNAAAAELRNGQGFSCGQAAYGVEMSTYQAKMEIVAARYGIDPITIISILMPLIIEAIRRCQDKPESVAAGLRRRTVLVGPRVRRCIRRYCRVTNGSEYMSREMTDTTFEHCAGLDDLTLMMMVDRIVQDGRAVEGSKGGNGNDSRSTAETSG